MSFLSLLTRSNAYSLYLPAHGRGAALPDSLRTLLQERAGSWDSPELPDFGGPLVSSGAVGKSQQEFADLLGVRRGWYGVNGATGLLQAALLSVSRPGEAVLMPRNIHRSIIQACVLGGLTPVLFDLPFLEDRGHYAPPDESWLLKVLDRLVEKGIVVSSAVLVHPTYHGYSNPLRPLVNQLHSRGLPVLVDEAHGTYLISDLDNDLPESALMAGADLVVHSLHKSAAGLSQTAVMWMQGDLVDPESIERSLSLFQTSSPSALLLASCESALKDLLSDKGKKKLRICLEEARELTYCLRKQGLPLLENEDPLRLILHTSVEGISGLDADLWYMNRGLVGELPEPGTLLFCLGFAPQFGLAKSMKSRWDQLLEDLGNKKSFLPFSPPPSELIAVPAMNCGEAWRACSKKVDLENAEGSIAAELICPYPPGIPIVIPGERLSYNLIMWLNNQRRLWPDQIPSSIRVVSC